MNINKWSVVALIISLLLFGASLANILRPKVYQYGNWKMKSGITVFNNTKYTLDMEGVGILPWEIKTVDVKQFKKINN